MLSTSGIAYMAGVHVCVKLPFGLDLLWSGANA